MGGHKFPLNLASALLAIICYNLTVVYASTSVSVELMTAFPAAPYLLELLETAAEENSTSYFPLLDRISDGYFLTANNDKELYERFIKILVDDNHLTSSESISLYQLDLSTRSSAPRIEAHYQYYFTAVEPSLRSETKLSCSTWILFAGKQHCSNSLDESHEIASHDLNVDKLEFDRILGNHSAPALILFADITSPTFGEFHKPLAKKAREGKFSYRVRYKKSHDSILKPLLIPGWGAELALKKTDYIVIDDRNEDESQTVTNFAEKEVRFNDDDLDDLKPLSTSEVNSLSIKASCFIMQSQSPLDTLVKLSQDFPKYSSALTSFNITQEFLEELKFNRAQLMPDGRNIMWINGLKLVERQIEALDLIDTIRKERKLIKSLRDLGFSPPQAIRFLSHNQFSSTQTSESAPRFDWRDDAEGGNVIIWMNNLEKDKRYADWPSSLMTLLQRGFSGQLPLVRRDTFNLIIPVDPSDSQDVLLILETILNFVNRRVPIRIGLVPITRKADSADQAGVLYHLVDTYGLQAAIAYLQSSSESKKLNKPSSSIFEQVIQGRKPKGEYTRLSLVEILNPNELQSRIKGSKNWISRLAANDEIPPILIDGVVISKDETWLQKLSQQINIDLQFIQQAILNFDQAIDSDFWVPSIFLEKAFSRRNSLIIPEDQKYFQIIDVNLLEIEHLQTFKVLPRILASSSIKSEWAFLILIVDLNTKVGEEIFTTITTFQKNMPSIELLILHNPGPDTVYGLGDFLFSYIQKNGINHFEKIEHVINILSAFKSENMEKNYDESSVYWQRFLPIVNSLGLLPGQNAILINGRLIGPIPDTTTLEAQDMEMLFLFEQKMHLAPIFAALQDLGIEDKIQDPLSVAKISSVVALSIIPEVAEGIFEEASTLRMSHFNSWNSSYTAIEVGNPETASIQLTVVLDPATPLGQRWVSILKVFSELDGVYMKLFLNPRYRLTELPVRRFYRYVLESKPSFDENGAIRSSCASFSGVPQEALLTVGLDIPPAWLVAPKISVHDLDNIKLSSIKSDIKAIYELEHILIEGHSREVSSGLAPRGIQLVLGTKRNPHAGDTIIMFNLGYFQFKANPGYYSISLQEGRSSEIFHIDSIDSTSWTPVPRNEKANVVLMSFKGKTLYPRISRKPGMETQDVLMAQSETRATLRSRGIKFIQNFLGTGNSIPEKQASINIFSVASGHLYERMLNIMMVSVMKHTKHSVKFWFIEQFLSPSFKDFIPHLAEEYGFSYEMVTYKWPHWLRAQSEKQREIWGYKILFLDVLFPLSLNKVIFVDADQIVRTDMIQLVNIDLKGAPYGFTPMCDSRTEMEGFRFWKKGYWERFLRGLPYHISALYVVDLRRFRQIAAGDRLRQQYHALSADPGSLANLDQDLPNHMQNVLPIFSLPQEWLWCETWCSDEALKDAKTIDLCNNPQTKEPKLDRARRQVPEWSVYDDEISMLNRKRKLNLGNENIVQRQRPLGVSGTPDPNESHKVQIKNSKSRNLEGLEANTLSKDKDGQNDKQTQRFLEMPVTRATKKDEL